MPVDLSKAMNARQTARHEQAVHDEYVFIMRLRNALYEKELDREFFADCVSGENGLTMEDYEEA